MPSACSVKNTGRFPCSVSVQEGILFRIGKCLSKLDNDVIFQIKGIVIKQFLRYLNRHMKLMCIQDLLVKSRIPKSQCPAFLDPACRRLGSRNIDLVLSGSHDPCGKTAHDIFFIQNINQPSVILLRNQITAVGIHALLKGIGNLAEVASQCIQHCPAVFIRSTSCLWLTLAACIRLPGQRLVYRLVQVLFHFLSLAVAVNRLCQILNLRFHSLIGCTVLRRQNTIFILMGIHKILCSFPNLSSLLH